LRFTSDYSRKLKLFISSSESATRANLVTFSNAFLIGLIEGWNEVKVDFVNIIPFSHNAKSSNLKMLTTFSPKRHHDHSYFFHSNHRILLIVVHGWSNVKSEWNSKNIARNLKKDFTFCSQFTMFYEAVTYLFAKECDKNTKYVCSWPNPYVKLKKERVKLWERKERREKKKEK
jgi:hypothetical protein